MYARIAGVTFGARVHVYIVTYAAPGWRHVNALYHKQICRSSHREMECQQMVARHAKAGRMHAVGATMQYAVQIPYASWRVKFLDD